jgi:hypothetical protein
MIDLSKLLIKKVQDPHITNLSYCNKWRKKARGKPLKIGMKNP